MSLDLGCDAPSWRMSHAGFDAARGATGLDALPAADLTALRRAGFVDGTGRTRAGRALCHELRGVPTLLLQASDDDGGVRRGRLHVGRRNLAAFLPVDDGYRLQVLPAQSVPLILARWGRLGPDPAPPRDRPYGVVSGALFLRRCADPGTPPPAAFDEAARAVWAAPWHAWAAHCDQLDIALRYVQVAGVGTLAVRRHEDTVTLVLRPSSLVWGELLAVWRVFAADPRLV